MSHAPELDAEARACPRCDEPIPAEQLWDACPHCGTDAYQLAEIAQAGGDGQ